MFDIIPSEFATPTLNPALLLTNYPSATVDQKMSLSEGRKFEVIQSLYKYNAHCHLGGEIPVETLLKYATPEQKETLRKAISEIASGQEYEKAFAVFPLISQIINSHERLKQATFDTCERFKLDNNRVVLMRTGLKQLENKEYEDYLTTVLSAIEDAKEENFDVFLLLSLKRSSTVEMARLTVDLALKYRDSGIIGIDISDISTQGDIRNIISELQRAKSEGLKLAVHMGESKEEKDQMLIIEQLQPDLIDHGVNLCDEAKEWVKNNKIPVTVCLTSAIATKMHDAKELHPWIREHLESDHPIDFGTDDSTVFGDIFLSDDIHRLCSKIDFEKIVKIATESFDRSRKFIGR